MPTDCIERKNCRLCAASTLDAVFELAPTPPGDHYLAPSSLANEFAPFPLTLCLCQSCGNLQLSHVVDPEILYGNYIYTTSISLGLDQHFAAYVRDLDSYSGGLSGKFVVDFGSNDGTCLRLVRDCGARVRGIETAESIAQAADASGVPTTVGFFNLKTARLIADREGRADVILANNVLANIDDLDEVLAAVKLLLRDDGLFVFETGYAVDLVESTVVDNITHEHLEYFAVRPLIQFLNRFGMKIVRVVHSASKGGSIRIFATPASHSRLVDASVQQHVAREESAKLFCNDTYRLLSRSVFDVGARLRKMIEEELQAGRQIVGYGASVGVTTLLHLFRLGETV